MSEVAMKKVQPVDVAVGILMKPNGDGVAVTRAI